MSVIQASNFSVQPTGAARGVSKVWARVGCPRASSGDPALCLRLTSPLGNADFLRHLNALRHKAAWYVASGVFLVLMAACCLRWLFLGCPAEPVYRGVGLARWLDGSMVIRTPVGISPGSGRAMGDVLRSVGTEALPWLVTEVELSGRPGPRDLACRFYARLWQSSALVRSLLPRPWSGPRSEIAVFNAMNLLGRLAPGTAYETNALHAVTAAHLQNNREFYKTRLYVLGCFTNFPNQVVPILVQELTNAAYVETAAKGLQNFGPSATPTLYPLALKETGQIRPAEYALEKADEIAYRKLHEEKDRLGLR